MNDFLEDVLSTFQLKSVLYFKQGFCGNWGMESAQSEFSQFHLVTNGQCVLKVKRKIVPLEKGDIAIFPHGDEHEIKHKADSSCVSGASVIDEIQNGKHPFKGKTPNAHLICGHFELDREVSHPLFTQLPKCIIVKSSDYGRYDLISSMFELLTEEMTNQKAGHELVSLKLSEVLFVSVIRHYYLKQEQESLNVFQDALIYKTINLIHSDLSNTWNIEDLAKQVGISRTLFIDRFKRSVGKTPLKYITNWRMIKAKNMLKNTDLSLVRIGEQVGYHSETSFNRAFKQIFNITPGKYRRLQNKAI